MREKKFKTKVCTVLLSLFMVLCLISPINALAAEVLQTSFTVGSESISKHGNIILPLTPKDVLDAGYQYGDILSVSLLDQKLELPLCSNFTEVDIGSPVVVLREAYNWVEIAINKGDFATTYNIAKKATDSNNNVTWSPVRGGTSPIEVTFSMKEAGGYYSEYIARSLSYSSNREDYPNLTDEQFANFRMVATTGIGKGKLYRSASPINPKYNRAKYADDAYRKAGVNVIMNLADDENTAKSYDGYGTTYYSGQKYVALNMEMDVSTDDFRAKLAQGLKFFSKNPGVYGIHCTEGKDRAGFVSAILECLMGASYDDVAADYMVTYYNYYGITPDDPRYEKIKVSYFDNILAAAFGVSDIKSANLRQAAETYLKNIGLTDAEISALKNNLSSSGMDTTKLSSSLQAALTGAWLKDNQYDSKKLLEATDIVLREKEDGLKASELKPAATASITGLTITPLLKDQKDNLEDNGLKPAIREFVKNTAKEWANPGLVTGKATAANILGIYYFDLTGTGAGDVTFKLEDKVSDAGDNYAIVLHYTGKASDEDGVTAQYVKVNSSGKLTAHFNSFSPAAIIATNVSSAQMLVNTYSHGIGSDESSGTAAAAPAAAAPAPSASVNAQTTGYYPVYNGTSRSILTALAACGETDTSKSNRARIAAANGITGYTGTAAQNVNLLKLLKAGTLKKP